MVSKVSFGSDAIDYLRSRLAASRTLWRMLSELDLGSGSIVGYFDAGASYNDRSRFSDGQFPRDKPDGAAIRETDDFLFRAVRMYLSHSDPPKRMAIGGCPQSAVDQYPTQRFEYWNLPWMQEQRLAHQRESRKTPMPSDFLVDRYVYLLPGPVSEEQFKSLWEWQSFWDRKCILTVCDPPELVHREVSEAFLRKAADATEYILLNAYDGDAPLVWARTPELAERFYLNGIKTS